MSSPGEDPDALAQNGLELYRRGQQAQAVELWKQLLGAHPDHATTHFSLGHAMIDASRPDLALPHAIRFGQQRPQEPKAWVLLGECFTQLGRNDDATRCYEEAVRLDPRNIRSRQLLAPSYLRQGQFQEAMAVLRGSREIAPDDPRVLSAMLMTMHYQPDTSPREIFHEHLQFDRSFAAGVAPLPHLDPDDRPVNRRLRVGYVSGDLQKHPVYSFIAKILAHHDHNAFEIFIYHTNTFEDEMTSKLRGYSDTWRAVATLNEEDLAQQIRRDRIDILVDLSGHCGHHRLLTFARRPAPVQATYLGYLDTTGVRGIDWRITDAVADPPGEADQLHTEKLLRLPLGFSCFSPPPGAAEVQDPPLLRHGGRVTFGSTHGLAKLNAPIARRWTELLRVVPDSRLQICRHELQGVAADRLRAMFRAAGAPDDRVEFRYDFDVNRHTELYHDIDIALDVLPWSGHTTGSEALWMGVPVVTLAGSNHAGRMMASVLTHAGFGELVATDEAHYIRIAADLARDPERLVRLRREMRQRLLASPFMDGARFTRALEDAYRRLWRGEADSA